MNLPNRLTVARIALVPVFLILFECSFPLHYVAAGLVFGAAALTDLFDGRIARARGLITNLGKFLDPIADKMLTTAAFVAFLAVSGQLDGLHPWVLGWCLLLMLTREFAVAAVRMLASAGGTVVAANGWGKLKTVMQFVCILYLLLALELSTWPTTFSLPIPASLCAALLTVGEALVVLCTVATVVSGVIYIRQNAQFLSEN